MNSAQIEARS